MNDSGQLLEQETPVNPYGLLEAVNRSSDGANAAWLIFLGLMAYLLITVAGVTHKDLLLNADISLPILQVKIDLTRFFLFAPILLVLLHMGLVGQLVLLARKTLEFTSALRLLETSELRSHPLRLELDNFFFVQSLAGPERSRVISAFLHSMSWLTLLVLPLALLLYVQLAFLPYHDAAITQVHRLAVLADIALIAFIGVFLMRAEVSLLRAFWRTSTSNPGSLTFAGALLAGAAFFALFVATIPAADRDERAAMFASPDGALFGLFRRNLDVADADLVVDKDVTPGEPSLSLRGRDLRFARLDRTDLHQADLTGANLDGASFVGADLRSVWLQCTDLNEMLLSADRQAGKCASARGANFARARLGDARLSGIDLTGARFEEAQMQGAELAHTLLAGASFAGARLERANLSGGVALPGANFLLAVLQGADLSGAKLPMADFTGAALQGVNLSLANLEGALLRDAELEGASLNMARLIGADLTGARLHAADFSGAVVWATRPPALENAGLADFAKIALRQPDEDDIAAIKAMLAAIEPGPLEARLTEGLAPMLDAGQMKAWASSPEQQTWASHVAFSEAANADSYKARVSEYLTRLMCRVRFANGATATGIARRAMTPDFKGDVALVHDRLRAADCPASSAMGAGLMRDLAAAADALKGQ